MFLSLLPLTPDMSLKKAVIFPILFLLFLALGLFAYYLKLLNDQIKTTFDNHRWALPTVVYARPLELYPGMALSADDLEEELQLASYRQEQTISAQGGYNRDGQSLLLQSRDFQFPSGPEQAATVRIDFSGNRLLRLVDIISNRELPTLRLDPARIGSFHPSVHEDRIVLKPEEVPTLLKQALMAVEDRNFMNHHGLSPTGIARALLVNLQAGKTVQGGSTITQQLVKNLFLDRKRTLQRKVQEALMALLLEFHYDKETILTAYINEVFLGQDGNRAIHGFALASQFYFRRNLNELSAAQVATLVGMVKGPSALDPRRYPERALNRRNVALNLLAEEEVIDQQTVELARREPLLNNDPQLSGFNRFPAYLDLVRRQLSSEYRVEDLQQGGLKILTNLDPQSQWQAESQLAQALLRNEQQHNVKELQGAVVVTGRDTGEILALVGDRQPTASGFNRALDAKRPIGSLVKPAVYLTALLQGYTLATPLQDTPIVVNNGKQRWTPQNYDRRSHGRVPFYQALANSYNLATVNLGMALGVEAVVQTLNKLGVEQQVPAYPSLLLGALDLSPLEVTQLYQTIASSGFSLPLRAIQAVMKNDQLISRYGLEVEQRFSPELMHLLTHALQRVVSEGTAKHSDDARRLRAAGKTGTTDDMRDSWFAGFCNDRLAVVWLGRDDNQPINLSGSAGALPVWAAMMTAMRAEPLTPLFGDGISEVRIDLATLQPTSPFTRNTTVLPFIRGTEPNPGSRSTGIDLDLREIEREARSFLDRLHNLIN